MKCLIINSGKGFYSIDGATQIPLDQITKDDMLAILSLVVDGDAEMDEYDENQLRHAAHRIIYKNLYSRLNDLSANKARFKDESTVLYRAAIDKYNVALEDDNSPYMV